MNTNSPTTTRDTCLQWWASHDGHTAAQVAAYFNGDGAEELAEGAGPIKPATLRQWKARHGLPATPSATKSTPKPAPLADPIQAAAVQPAAVWIDVGDVVPWIDNPRDNDDAAERVAESIARFGYGRAFVGWRPDGERMLVVGHTARKASLILRDRRPVYAFQTDGDKCRGCGQPLDGKHAAGCAVAIPPEVPREGMIPMRWRADWTEAEARAYAIADNQLGSLSEWMPDLLAEQLADLEQHDFGLGLLGWDTGTDLDALLADLTVEVAPSQVEVEPEEIYTAKIKAPIYEKTGKCPALAELICTNKQAELTADIEAADLPHHVREFLLAAASRHTVFHYRRIAEYYCHASPLVQGLMERSALVIIDFDKAVEGGFVFMTQEMAALANSECAHD